MLLYTKKKFGSLDLRFQRLHPFFVPILKDLRAFTNVSKNAVVLNKMDERKIYKTSPEKHVIMYPSMKDPGSSNRGRWWPNTVKIAM